MSLWRASPPLPSPRQNGHHPDVCTDLVAVPKSRDEQDNGDRALVRSQPNHAADAFL